MAHSGSLQRFVQAQNPVYNQVVSELQQGRKHSHWMWFVLPQLQGLGKSEMARQYAIADLQEARCYLQHALLGSRLRQCTRLVTDIVAPIEQAFPWPDHLKLCSSMALFLYASDNHTDKHLCRYCNSILPERRTN